MPEPEHQHVDARGYATDKIRAEQLELLIDQSYPAAYMSLVVAGLLVMILWPAQDHRKLLLWFSAAVITGMLRVGVFLHYWRWPPGEAQVATRERAYLITMMLYFTVWGVGSLWVMPGDSPVHQVVVSYFLIGMAGSAIAVFSANRFILLCAVAILLLPSLVWFYSRGDLLSIGIAAGGTAFLLSAIRSSRVLSHAMRQNLRLKHSLMRAKSAAENLARIDELTGLANRRAFYEAAENAAAQSRRLGTPLSLIALDVDHFKKINDSHGHLWGDNALQHLATLMTGSLRSTDFCGRIGGEEFAVLLPGTALQDAVAVAEELRRDLAAAPLQMPDGELTVTASMGVTEGNGGVGELMQQADTALYLAKENGRNRVERYQASAAETEDLDAVIG